MTQQILMIVSNPAISTTLGWPVGFWASELIHPYSAFTEAGCQVTIASPKGGNVEFDALSDPRDESGYSKDDSLSLHYIQQPEFMQLLDDTPSIADLALDAFDAVVICGGQGPMFTYRQDTALANLFMAFYEAGKPSSALCHGTCLLLETKLKNGEYLIQSKTMTGFANSEEDFADQTVGQTVMPFRIEDEAKKLGADFVTGEPFSAFAVQDEAKKLGADFVTGEPFSAFAVQDGNLITGQQQNSGTETAKLVLSALGVNS